MEKVEGIVCLDTTELINIIKGKENLDELKNKSIATTQINAFELACGGESNKDILVIEDFVKSFPKKTIKTKDAF